MTSIITDTSQPMPPDIISPSSTPHVILPPPASPSPSPPIPPLPPLPSTSTSSSSSREPPPKHTRYVKRQAGGHHEQNGDILIPNLEHDDGSFLKLYRTPRREHTELAFYQSVFSSECRDSILLELRSLIPNFKGLYPTKFRGKEVKFLKVEDITRRFVKPCVLDVKLKADVHDPNSTHSHPVYDFAQKYGFLIDGIQVYHRLSGEYVSFDKAFGRNLNEEGVRRGLISFLNADKNEADEFLVQALLDRLKRIHSWTRRQRHFSFYRSSLLLVYDAQQCPCLNLKNGIAATDVRMVDFAKVYPSDENDSPYEKAIANFTQFLTSLLMPSSNNNNDNNNNNNNDDDDEEEEEEEEEIGEDDGTTLT